MVPLFFGALWTPQHNVSGGRRTRRRFVSIINELLLNLVGAHALPLGIVNII